jgi:hypothetical protein
MVGIEDAPTRDGGEQVAQGLSLFEGIAGKERRLKLI